MKETFKKAITSRTIITLIIMFLIAGIDGIRELFDPNIFTAIMAVLTGLAGFYKINPSQDY